MVQMKAIHPACCKCEFPSFISHMVQMKAILSAAFMVRFLNFISHMVQMKEQAIINFRRLETPLYPTWFR